MGHREQTGVAVYHYLYWPPSQPNMTNDPLLPTWAGFNTFYAR